MHYIKGQSDMVYNVFSFIVSVVDAWSFLYFMDTFLKKKEIGKWEKYRFILCCVSLYLVSLLFHMMEIVINWWKVLFVLVVLFVIGRMYFRTTTKQLGFYLLLCYGLMLLTEFFVLSMVELIASPVDLTSETNNYLLGVVAKLLQVIIVLGIRRFWKPPNELGVLNGREWCMINSIPAFSIAGIMWMFHFFGEDRELMNLCLFLTMGLLGINFVIIYLLQDILDKNEQLRLSMLANQNAKNQIEAYHDMDALYERQRKKAHDYKNQIVTIRNLVQDGNINKAVNFMEQLTESLAVDLSAINTNHPVVNAVLNHKFHTAKEKQIAMIFQVGDVHEIHLTEEEIVILLGNLLDNAIVECEKVVKVGRDAVIQFKLVYEDGKTILCIKNPVLKKVEIVDNKVQANPKNGHGIGLRNVEAVTEKYEGSIAFDCDEKEFRVVVIL